MMAKLFFVVLAACAWAAFAGECESKQYSKDLTVKIPLYDSKGLLFPYKCVFSCSFLILCLLYVPPSADASVVEVTQRFDLVNSPKRGYDISIDCVTFYFSTSNKFACYKGDLVIREVSSTSDEPGKELFRIDSGICPTDNFYWYSYTESFRLTIPGRKKSVFIGYETVGTAETHTVLSASRKGVAPQSDSYMMSNLTNKWENIGKFYGHLGMNADISLA